MQTKLYLAAWRLLRGFPTQAAFARHVGTTHATISRLESGKQRYNQKTLEMLAAGLDCEPRDLLFDPDFVLLDFGCFMLGQTKMKMSVDYVELSVKRFNEAAL